MAVRHAAIGFFARNLKKKFIWWNHFFGTFTVSGEKHAVDKRYRIVWSADYSSYFRKSRRPTPKRRAVASGGGASRRWDLKPTETRNLHFRPERAHQSHRSVVPRRPPTSGNGYNMQKLLRDRQKKSCPGNPSFATPCHVRCRRSDRIILYYNRQCVVEEDEVCYPAHRVFLIHSVYRFKHISTIHRCTADVTTPIK